MTSPEASLFGFPNPLLGVAGLVAPIAVGSRCSPAHASPAGSGPSSWAA
ncbi:MAG: hypothetical protein ACJLS2_11095 [Microcella pacifica]|nr:hypothetical protein [Microcella pacifica]